MTKTDLQDLSARRDTLQKTVEALLELGDQYFLPEALELLRRTRDKPQLSDDEVLLLTVTAAQAARAHYLELQNNGSHRALDVILNVLDHEDVIRAEFNKLYALFREEPNVPLAFLGHDERQSTSSFPLSGI